MDQNITPKQALELLAQVAAQFRGTRQEHELIERAFRTLSPLVEPPQPPAE
jgi:hypothetical protein